ncbi:hypothetical protein MHH81_20500 [Psychrobacillus sp. FSL H8-0484]|uniref:hypothetical protein n=1 Tax=Psychrobacillus sp. FSL H8-0484 TaxID=2921390 RepID=UPI0030FCDCA8
MQPKITGLTSLDAAVLMEKAILLNGMILHGTAEQKAYAKEEFPKLSSVIRKHINLEAQEIAKRELALEHDFDNLDMLPNVF